MKKMISFILILTMTMGLVSCTDAEDNDEHDDGTDIAAFFTDDLDRRPEGKADEESGTPAESTETAATTTVTTVTEPETTTEQTTTAAPETTTTTTTTTEPPELLPVISGSGAIMNDSVNLVVTGDPNTGTITFYVENNSGGAVFLFDIPTLVVDNYSVQLDHFANLMVTSNKVAANAQGIIELNASPEQIKSGMRITGQFFCEDLSDFSNKNFDITLT